MRILMIVSLIVACAFGAALGTSLPCQAAEKVNQNVHVFYYPWYGNPETDGSWAHWNHPYPDGTYEPPEDIGANFYPEKLYSSNSPKDVALQMDQIAAAGIGVVCVSWWGPGDYTDKAVPLILKTAEERGLTVNFHIEPFKGRSAKTVREAIVYITETYGDSPAFYRDSKRDNRPLYYVYDSYLTEADEWASILAADAKNTIRGTKYDADIIALFVKKGDESFVKKGYFDGFYTYFAVDGFTHGCTPANWPAMAAWAKANGKVFIPSVAPGYIDTRIRPWNNVNTRGRENGAYYDRMFKAAVDLAPLIVSITSFNEWHEGSQIEPAVPKKIEGYTYEDYRPRKPGYYLKRTKYWVKQYEKAVNK